MDGLHLIISTMAGYAMCLPVRRCNVNMPETSRAVHSHKRSIK